MIEENLIQITGGIMINVDPSVKNVMYVKKIMFGILLNVIVKMENISITDDSAITYDVIIESYDKEAEIVPTNFKEKKSTCKTQIFYILLAFLLITTALFIAANIYCYLIKYQANQKHLLREVLY